MLTGSSGLIGTQLRQALEKAGHFVITVDTKEDAKLDFTNAFIMRQLLGRYKPDTVIHLAALKDMNEAASNPDLYHSVNVKATRDLIDLSILAGVKNFIFSSSASVYDGVNAYADSKRAIEDYLSSVSSSIKSVIIRLESVLDDSGQAFTPTPHGLLDNLMMAYKEGKEFVQNGNPIRGFMALSYAVELILQAISLTKGGTIVPINSIVCDISTFIRIFNSELPTTATRIQPVVGEQRSWEINKILPARNTDSLAKIIRTVISSPYVATVPVVGGAVDTDTKAALDSIVTSSTFPIADTNNADSSTTESLESDDTASTTALTKKSNKSSK